MLCMLDIQIILIMPAVHIFLNSLGLLGYFKCYGFIQREHLGKACFGCGM